MDREAKFTLTVPINRQYNFPITSATSPTEVKKAMLEYAKAIHNRFNSRVNEHSSPEVQELKRTMGRWQSFGDEQLLLNRHFARYVNAMLKLAQVEFS